MEKSFQKANNNKSHLYVNKTGVVIIPKLHGCYFLCTCPVYNCVVSYIQK